MKAGTAGCLRGSAVLSRGRLCRRGIYLINLLEQLGAYGMSRSWIMHSTMFLGDVVSGGSPCDPMERSPGDLYRGIRRMMAITRPTTSVKASSSSRTRGVRLGGSSVTAAGRHERQMIEKSWPKARTPMIHFIPAHNMVQKAESTARPYRVDPKHPQPTSIVPGLGNRPEYEFRHPKPRPLRNWRNF